MMRRLTDLEGQTLGGYRLLEQLGAGGMAAVYRGANALAPGVERAIKVVYPELAENQEFRSRFIQEATTLETLVHPNVVRFFGVRTASVAGREWLLMELELLRGRSLAEVRGGVGGPEVRRCVEWMAQACAGVAAAHAAGVVHRDLKPANLYVADGGEVKVLDFGVARLMSEGAAKLTQTGHTPGTWAYMAPELWDGEAPDARVDVYALGLSLHELLVGRHAFAGVDPGSAPSATRFMKAHLTEAVPALVGRVAGVTPRLDAVLAKATAKARGERYADARELGAALADVLEHLEADWRALEADAFHTRMQPLPDRSWPVASTDAGPTAAPAETRGAAPTPAHASGFSTPGTAPRGVGSSGRGAAMVIGAVALGVTGLGVVAAFAFATFLGGLGGGDTSGPAATAAVGGSGRGAS